MLGFSQIKFMCAVSPMLPLVLNREKVKGASSIFFLALAYLPSHNDYSLPLVNDLLLGIIFTS